jgi:tagaturonate reductase
MQLSKETIKHISPKSGLIIPDEKLLDLPEKVLQFGTGVLLRGLPDYFIDKANRQGIFNGRVVIVKSTLNGGTDEFDKQDGLFTLCVRGIENGNKIDEAIISSAISRVVSATEEWEAILQCAHDPQMQVIISNTTEAGIVLSDDDINVSPPPSFPGKLLAFLVERYKAFGGTSESGMVIIPTELLTDNGTQLLDIVLQLAANNNLDNGFISWLQSANHFCNSLVDRIVPGKLPKYDRQEMENKLGYKDDLMIMAESFRLWAIESDNERVKQILSFTSVDNGAVIAPGIEKFRELKLRLLNGTHSFSCALAFLAGFETVKDAMNDGEMSVFIRRLMMLELATALESEIISYNEACVYANTVTDRFRNPFLDHQWLSITLQYSLKMRMRNVPLLQRHYAKSQQPPACMALGFAAFILFMKGSKNESGSYEGEYNGKNYVIQDDNAAKFAEKWENEDSDQVVEAVLADKDLWGVDLSELSGFSEVVKTNLKSLMENGAIQTLEQLQLKKAYV